MFKVGDIVTLKDKNMDKIIVNDERGNIRSIRFGRNYEVTSIDSSGDFLRFFGGDQGYHKNNFKLVSKEIKKYGIALFYESLKRK